jgi:hypothetical protein
MTKAKTDTFGQVYGSNDLDRCSPENELPDIRDCSNCTQCNANKQNKWNGELKDFCIYHEESTRKSSSIYTDKGLICKQYKPIEVNDV